MDKQIKLLDLVKFYMHRWWILVIGLLAGAILFGTYTACFVTPIYQSTCSFYTENSKDMLTQDATNVNLNTIMVRKELVATYAEVLSSNVFMKKVAEESDLGYTKEEILSMLSMTSRNNTEILAITVGTPDPKHSYTIAKTIMDLAEGQISDIVAGGSVKVLDEPEYPKTQSSPNVARNLIIGAAAGLLLAMFILFLIEILDNRVKDAEKLTEILKYPLLGEIPYFPSDDSAGKAHKHVMKL